MSLQYWSCISCGQEHSIFGIVPEEFNCKACKAHHETVGYIWGYHVSHPIHIFKLKDMDKLTLVSFTAAARNMNKRIEVEWLIKDIKKIEQYENELGLVGMRQKKDILDKLISLFKRIK